MNSSDASVGGHNKLVFRIAPLRYKSVLGNAENLLTALGFRERFSSRFDSTDKQLSAFDAPITLNECGKLITPLNDEAMIGLERDLRGWVTDIIAPGTYNILFSGSYTAASEANRDDTEKDNETH